MHLDMGYLRLTNADLGPSQTIKTHHNVGGLPAVMKLKLIEPLRELFKDEGKNR